MTQCSRTSSAGHAPPRQCTLAWLCRHQHGIQVADATCLRILREAGLVLAIDYARERKNLAAGRRAAFVAPVTRRTRVW